MTSDVVPIPRTLETPPRTTGNPQLDLPLLVDWFYRAYQVITESVRYINGGSLADGDNISLLNNDSGYIGFDYYALESDILKFSNIVRGQEPSGSSDFTTKNYVDTNIAATSHAAVTVTDSAEIDFTLSVQNITASIKAGSISSVKLDTGVTTSLGLADTSVQPGDSISDLVLNAGGNTIHGSSVSGGDLTLASTSHATKGSIILGSLEVNEVLGAVGIGSAPAGNSPFSINGLPTSSAGLSVGEIWNDGGTLKIV